MDELHLISKLHQKPPHNQRPEPTWNWNIPIFAQKGKSVTCNTPILKAIIWSVLLFQSRPYRGQWFSSSSEWRNENGKTWSWQCCSVLANLYIHVFPSFASFSWFSGHSEFGKKEIMSSGNSSCGKSDHGKEVIMDCSLQGQTFGTQILGMLCMSISFKRGKMHWLLYISKVGLVFLPPQTTRSVGTDYNHPSWDQMLPREKWSKCNKSENPMTYVSFLNEAFSDLVFFLLTGLICL